MWSLTVATTHSDGASRKSFDSQQYEFQVFCSRYVGVTGSYAKGGLVFYSRGARVFYSRYVEVTYYLPVVRLVKLQGLRVCLNWLNWHASKYYGCYTRPYCEA